LFEPKDALLFYGFELPAQDRKMLGLKWGKKPPNWIVSFLVVNPVLAAGNRRKGHE
jgi:hypothetical protein